jgi:hypothetical protein
MYPNLVKEKQAREAALKQKEEKKRSESAPDVRYLSGLWKLREGGRK